MKNVINNKDCRGRRGITITEVAIALALIAIISASTLSVVMFAVNAEKKSLASVEMATSAENAIACFRYAEDENEFFKALNKTGTYTREEDGSFRMLCTGHAVTIRADFGVGYFDYSAVNYDGEEIQSFRYPATDDEGGAP